MSWCGQNSLFCHAVSKYKNFKSAALVILVTKGCRVVLIPVYNNHSFSSKKLKLPLAVLLGRERSICSDVWFILCRILIYVTLCSWLVNHWENKWCSMVRYFCPIICSLRLTVLTHSIRTKSTVMQCLEQKWWLKVQCLQYLHLLI